LRDLSDILNTRKEIKTTKVEYQDNLLLLKEYGARNSEESQSEEDHEVLSKLENEICRINQNLVKKIAAREFSKFRKKVGYHVEFDDAVAAGMEGLLMAIRKFDTGYNGRLSTYATWWIRQKIRRFLEDNLGIIRIPNHMLSKVRKAEMYPHLYPACVESMRKHQKVLGSYRSLSEPVSAEDDNMELEDILPNNPSCAISNPEHALVSKDIYERCLRAIREKSKDERNYYVLIERYGLRTGEGKTLEETGNIFNVTRERIRQIEAKTLERLVHSKVISEADLW
jgi:RNA polymerase primary sigma factor